MMFILSGFKWSNKEHHYNQSERNKMESWRNYDKNPKQPPNLFQLNPYFFLSPDELDLRSAVFLVSLFNKANQFAVKHNILSGHINAMVGVCIWQFWFGGVWFVFSNSLSCNNLCWSNVSLVLMNLFFTKSTWMHTDMHERRMSEVCVYSLLKLPFSV